MISQDSILVQLVRLVDHLPTPPPSATPRRGRPRVYPDGLFLKALTIMIVRRLHRVGELLAVLEEPTPEMRSLRSMLSGPEGRFPSRRTFERRLRALPETLPERIGLMGRHLVELLKPWAKTGRAAALDSTVLRAKGGVWHKKDKQAGVVPHSSIDTEAGWTKSGWHGWVYGWKLHLACTVGGVWIPLAARLTPANVHDGRIAPHLIEELPQEARFVLGDKHYDAEDLKEKCLKEGRFMVSPRRGAYPHTDDGVEVRRIFHLLRHRAIENLNGHFKALFDAHGSVPTKGLADTARFALGAILVYQLALLHRHEDEERRSDTNRGLKAFLRAA
jgi:Transposase DDE domain